MAQTLLYVLPTQMTQMTNSHFIHTVQFLAFTQYSIPFIK